MLKSIEILLYLSANFTELHLKIATLVQNTLRTFVDKGKKKRVESTKDTTRKKKIRKVFSSHDPFFTIVNEVHVIYQGLD